MEEALINSCEKDVCPIDKNNIQYDPLLPCLLPLKTIEELVKWEPSSPACCSHVPLVPRTIVNSISNTQKTVVCHDYRDQYLEDRFAQGAVPPHEENYTFFNWQYVDMFIYFSHHFVTIPPLVWVSAAHRHGVPILGTFITEHDGENGRERCVEMLSDRVVYLGLIDKLVDVADYYNFDGWLINIENTIPENLVDNLIDFVTELKSRVAKRLRHGHVMWYDSVTRNGDLAWQNALNENNMKFFAAADSIYLNYAWTDDNLVESAALAKSLGRSADVYVGVDVFGRSMKCGGGFSTVEAVQCVRSVNLSVALFSVSWVLEKNDPSQILQNEDRFWASLHDLCPQHGTTSLPLSSHFCRGLGTAFYYHGQVVSTQPWYNLALQSLQPSYNQTQFRHHHLPLANMSYHTDEAFLGGGCLRLTTPISADGHTTIFKLFATNVVFTESMFVSYTLKCTEITDAFLELRLEREGVHRNVHLCESDPFSSQSSHVDTVTAMDIEKASDVLGAYAYWMCLVGQQQWLTRCFVVDKGQIEGWTLTCVGVGVHQKIGVDCPTYDTDSPVTCEALLGQIQINAMSLFDRHPPIIKDTKFTRDTPPSLPNTMPHHTPIRGWVSWTSDLPHDVDFCNIYVYCGLDLDNLTLLGQSSTSTFRVSDVPDLPATFDVSFLIQPVLYSGFVESISMCCSISLDADLSCNENDQSNAV